MKTFIFLFFISTSVRADEAQRLSNMVKEGTEILSAWERMLKVDCQIDQGVYPSKLSNDEGKDVEVAQISFDYVEELYREIAKSEHIPFDYVEDGGEARALEIARILDRKGVKSAKAFLEGDLKLKTYKHPDNMGKWKSQTASIVKVRMDDGKDVVYVIDPALFNRAIPLEEWAYKLSGDPEKISFASRFNYSPKDKLEQLTDYRHEDLSLAEIKFSSQKKLLQKRRTESVN